MVLRILFAPITGLTWIAEQLQERVDAEMNVKENLQKELLALQLAFDMGDVEEEEFETREEELLLALQAIDDQERAERAAEAEAE
ncbi:MAG TPA: gas vesicle protein GvpG [Leptolyngbyaceae cyanobacterium M33_DOE_097]|uniref:Gas vesicle protein GvpG n=1 Tax=Oscillatoriales cyanobacterium SpSt-418 TaxID=2282169 RepID=A0A7C3PAK6_9CYAN|nr:gas vesicle protein GvpG [Leptolyngbyaceae cyanobacterium M33_DOE_097]